MDLKQQKDYLEELYREVDGYEISKIANLRLKYYSQTHIYGEIEFDPFYRILQLTNPIPGEVFYDLGSGTGKAVMLAAACFPFSKCVGVEKLKELYDISCTLAEKSPYKNVEYRYSNFNNADFSDGDVIFLNSYYFHYEMTNPTFISKVNRLKPGTRMIFVKTPLHLPILTLIHQENCVFSWGTAPVYIMRKG